MLIRIVANKHQTYCVRRAINFIYFVELDYNLLISKKPEDKHVTEHMHEYCSKISLYLHRIKINLSLLQSYEN